MAAPRPASASPQGVLAKAELELGIQAFLQKCDPGLKEKADFELENARECLLFSRPFFAEDKLKSVSLTKAILFLTTLQNALKYPETELQDVPWKADSYNGNALVESFQEKVVACTALKSKAALEKKADEVESAAKFIARALDTIKETIPQTAALQGSVVCLDDLYVHLEFRFANMDP